ncbi:MAG: carboxypeptidase-like regulatory domain-containing protein [Deltaproteobacteria bacterium]
MKLRYAILAILSLLLVAGCDETITGFVVDAETGKPIEGAVILVEWTKVKGLPGLTHTESYKVVEVITDKEGKASIEGVVGLFVDLPRVTVYKKGYVAWNNEYIFPDWEKRTDFKWENNYVFKLEKFKLEYSYDKHTFFLHTSILDSTATEKKQLIQKAYDWEEYKSLEERRKK